MTAQNAITTRDEWLNARKDLLLAEKELTRMRDQIAAARRALPWVKVEQNYVFESSAGPVTLTDLFEGRSQLLVYHFMFAPEWSQGCKSCSLLADHYDPAIVHLNQRDVSMVTVSRAPIEQLMVFRERMGWNFRWVSSNGNSFNRDFGIYFTAADRQSGLALYNYTAAPPPINDLPGLSAFVRDESGDVHHTYSTYARGLDPFLNVYQLLDVTSKGRHEDQISGMSWVRHHDRYGVPGFVDPWVEAGV